MIGWRLAAAAAILCPLIGLLIADFKWNLGTPGIWLAPLGLVIGLLASGEVLDLLRTPGHRPRTWVVFVGVALIYVSACLPMAWDFAGVPYPPDCPFGKLGLPLTATAAAMVLAFVAEMRRFAAPGGAIVNLSLSMLVTLYIGLSMAFVSILRQFHSNAWGMAALVSVVFIVKLSDTGAYAVGKTLGRRKLTPRLSPGKTVEGAVGGLVTAILASWLFFVLIAPRITGEAPSQQLWWRATLYGGLLGIVAMIGDLGESLIKRDVQRKDSSSWLPGLGGVLDIMDSLFFAGPLAYVAFATGLVGPLASGR